MAALAIALLAPLSQIWAAEIPVPPRYSLPAVSFGLPTPNDHDALGGLRFGGAAEVIHRLDLDRSPLRWADRLLTMAVGAAEPWNPANTYALFPTGLTGCEGHAIALFGADLLVFDGVPGVDKPSVASLNRPGYTLHYESGHLIVTLVGDRRWFFSPLHFGASWRLEQMELVGYPGAIIKLVYDGPQLSTITYPNSESISFNYDNHGIATIRLPFGEEARFVRDSQGRLRRIEVVRASLGNAERGVLRRYEYQLDDQNRITGFMDDRGLGFDITYQAQETGDAKQPETTYTAVVRNRIDGAYAFRRCAVNKDRERRIIDGFGAADTSIDRAVAEYEPSAFTVKRLAIKPNPRRRPEALQFLPRPAEAVTEPLIVRYALLEPEPAANPIMPIPGVPTSEDPALAGAAHHESDSLGRVTKTLLPGNKAAAFTYSENGDLVEAKTDDRLYTYETDTWGRIVGVEEANIQDEPQRKLRWGFDATGYLQSLTVFTARPRPPDQPFAEVQFDQAVTTYERDRLGRVTQVHYLTRQIEKFIYDPDPRGSGRMLAWEQQPIAKPPSRVRYSYDKLGRLTDVNDPRRRQDKYTYQPSGQLATHEFADAGQPRTKREYNLRGQLVAESVAGLGTTRYAYDDKGRRHRITHPDGTETIYTFDDLSRITSIRGNHQPPVDITYDAAGERRVHAVQEPPPSRAAGMPAPGGATP